MIKFNNLTHHYCEAFIDAAVIGAYNHCDFLSSQQEFCDTYISKKRGHIINYIALIGNHSLLEESFKNSKDLSETRFLDIIINAAQSGDIKSLRIVLDNFNRFKDNDRINYNYNIDCALRYAGAFGHLDVFNYLLSIGAKPNQWHVIRFTAGKGPNNTYDRLLQVNNLPPSTKRKSLINLCESESNKGNFNFIDLSNLL
jgi:hypothetical protein